MKSTIIWNSNSTLQLDYQIHIILQKFQQKLTL